MMRYNPATYSWEANPEGKYAYGATCVKNCPEHLLKDNGACVRSCPSNKKAVNGECVPCDGPCPKNCQGVDTINSDNIDSFQGCTIIEGSFTLLENSFTGYQEVYQNFTFGQHNIQAAHSEFRNLSFFRNLEIIGGRQLTEYFSAFYVVKTSLVSLGLRSLKYIRSGSVAILENKDLCFANTIDWKKVMRSTTHSMLLLNNKETSSCRKCFRIVYWQFSHL